MEKLDTQVEELVNELVAIQQHLDDLEVDDLLKRKDEIRKALAQLANQEDPEQVVEFKTKVGEVVFSKAPKTRKVTEIKSLAIVIGDEALYGIASVSLKSLGNLLPKGEIDQYCTVVYGARKLSKVVPA